MKWEDHQKSFIQGGIASLELMIELLAEHKDTKKAREIMQRELMNFRLKLEAL